MCRKSTAGDIKGKVLARRALGVQTHPPPILEYSSPIIIPAKSRTVASEPLGVTYGRYVGYSTNGSRAGCCIPYFIPGNSVHHDEFLIYIILILTI